MKRISFLVSTMIKFLRMMTTNANAAVSQHCSMPFRIRLAAVGPAPGIRLRILMVAAVVGTFLSVVGVSAPAQAATKDIKMTNFPNNNITNGGYDNLVTLTLVGTPYTPIDQATVDGHTVYQYEVFVGGAYLCLQDDINSEVVIEGLCVKGNARQQWWYDNSRLLVNIAGSLQSSPCARGGNGYVIMYPCDNDNQEYWTISPY